MAAAAVRTMDEILASVDLNALNRNERAAFVALRHLYEAELLALLIEFESGARSHLDNALTCVGRMATIASALAERITPGMYVKANTIAFAHDKEGAI